MRIRWGPGRPDTLRIFTGSAHPKRLGLACTDIAPGATRTAKGSAPAAGDTTQIHCSWPQEDGATMTVVIEESARGTTLAAFHPPHLEWDADYARTLGIIDAP